MSLIWYNPDKKSYLVGSQLEFEIQQANSSSPHEMMILYELDDLTERIAEKIVNELNAARTEFPNN